MLAEIGYFLEQLNDPAATDENGLTILDNSLVTISTESGDGRHNDVQRELNGIFHAVTSANERFRVGEIVDVNAEGIDVYNSMLGAMGVSQRVGPSSRAHNAVTNFVR